MKIIVTRGTGEHDFTIPARNKLQPNVLVYARPLDEASLQKFRTASPALQQKMTADITAISFP